MLSCFISADSLKTAEKNHQPLTWWRFSSSHLSPYVASTSEKVELAPGHTARVSHKTKSTYFQALSLMSVSSLKTLDQLRCPRSHQQWPMQSVLPCDQTKLSTLKTRVRNVSKQRRMMVWKNKRLQMGPATTLTSCPLLEFHWQHSQGGVDLSPSCPSLGKPSSSFCSDGPTENQTGNKDIILPGCTALANAA